MKRSLYILLLLFLFSCKSEYEAPEIVSDISSELQFTRVDSLVFNDGEAINKLGSLDSNFAKVYVEDVMRLAPYHSAMVQDQLDLFVQNDLWIGLQREIDSVFSDLNTIESTLEKALLKSRKVYPALAYPNRLFWFNSGFNVAIYPSETFLGVGLEWYLGANSKFVSMLPPVNFPMYKREKMEKERLVPDLLRGFFLYSLYSEQSEEDLLNLMVFYGKALFMLQQVSDFSDAMILNYSNDEFNWVTSHEKKVWQQLVREDWLYTKDRKVMNEMTKDGPFTKGFSQDSPPRLGWFLGYRMLCDYSSAHKDANLSEIMHAPAKEILKFYKKP